MAHGAAPFAVEVSLGRNSGLGQRAAMFGMMTALAMIMGYVEAQIPISLGVPGVKLGLANLVTMLCLYRMGPVAAALVSVTRIVLTGVTFGNLFSMLYALAGGAVSIIVMILMKKSGRFGPTGVSVAGGVAHNVGQLLVAALVVENAGVLWYLPVLLPAGTVAGTLIGMLTGTVLERTGRL